MEDQDNLKEFFKVLGSTAARDILYSIYEGKNQHKEIMIRNCKEERIKNRLASLFDTCPYTTFATVSPQITL